MLAAVKARLRNRRSGSIGSAGAGFPGDEDRQQEGPDRRATPRICGSVQPRSLPLIDAPHDDQQAGADEAEAGQVEAASRTVRLVEAEEGERDRDEPDRDVEPEDPVPGEALGDGATDERPDRRWPDPAMPPQAPSATARRSGGTAADRMVRLSGVTIAPPMPWMARARIRTSLDRRRGPPRPSRP